MVRGEREREREREREKERKLKQTNQAKQADKTMCLNIPTRGECHKP